MQSDPVLSAQSSPHEGNGSLFTIVHQSVRHDEKLRPRPIDGANLAAHGVHVAQGRFLCPVRQASQHFVNLVGRLEGEGWHAHSNRHSRFDEVVDDAEELGRSLDPSVVGVGRLGEAVSEYDAENLRRCRRRGAVFDGRRPRRQFEWL